MEALALICLTILAIVALIFNRLSEKEEREMKIELEKEKNNAKANKK